MPELDAAAPAQPVASPTPIPSASEQAAANDDVLAFRDARRAERTAKSTGTTPTAPAQAPAPVQAEPPAPVAPAPTVDAKAVSKRQQQINDYERRLAELQIENARLKSSSTPPASAQVPQKQTLAARLESPDVSRPSLTEGEFYAEHPESTFGDYAEYRAAYRMAHARAEETRRTQETTTRTKAQEQIATAVSSFEARVAVNPALKDKVAPLFDPNSPNVLRSREQVLEQLEHLKADPQYAAAFQRFNAEAVAAGRRPVSIAIGPIEDFSSELLKSPHFGVMVEYLADHPDTLDEIRALESRSDVLAYFGEFRARFKSTASAVPALKTITTAPSPPPTLGSRNTHTSDPLAAAAKDDDVSAYRAARLTERLATRRR